MGRSSERNQEASSPRSLSQEGKGEPYPHIAESLRPLAVPIDTLMPDAANARRHSERNLEAIKASLTRFGQRAPIVVQRDGMIVRAGNGRLEAAKSLGWTHIAAVIVDDSSVDAVAFAIADNRTAELAEWDTETLATLLDSLPQDVKIDTGFTDADLEQMLEEIGKYAVDEVAAPELNSDERVPIQQMTFVLHDDQAEKIKEAIRVAKEMGPFVDTGNENSNGNAIARVAETFLGNG